MNDEQMKADLAVLELVWVEKYTDRGAPEVWGWEAVTPSGADYTVEMSFGTDSFTFHAEYDGVEIGNSDDELMAKEIAQDHFNERIHDALSARLANAVQPAAGEGGLREALEFYAENWRPPANAIGRTLAPNVLYPSTALLHDGGDRARAALSTSVPAGVVVPREPTEAMHNAARDWSLAKYGQGIGRDASAGCWAAMLDAAPPAQETTR